MGGWYPRLDTELNDIFHIQDPMKLFLGKNYNLNIVKEIEVRSLYLTLSKDIIGCQNQESQIDCKTRNYLESLIKICHCLPFNIRASNKVTPFKINYESTYNVFCTHFAILNN